MTQAMTQRYEAMAEARRRLLDLLAGQALATTELTTGVFTRWFEASLRTAHTVWSPVADLPARTVAAVAAERTAGQHMDEAAQDCPDESGESSAVADSGTVNVVFRLPAAVNAQTARLCGDFNGWSRTAEVMERCPDGSFELTRALPVGRRFRYRYLLDADRWENDWAADDYVPNASGDDDSVVDLHLPSTSRLVMQN